MHRTVPGALRPISEGNKLHDALSLLQEELVKEQASCGKQDLQAEPGQLRRPT